MMFLLGMLYGAVATGWLIDRPWRWYWKVSAWMLGMAVFGLLAGATVHVVRVSP